MTTPAAGAEPFFIDPEEHDAYVAGVSHLPFVLSAALMNAVSRDPSWRDMKMLTAGGFRDATRLAAILDQQAHEDCDNDKKLQAVAVALWENTPNPTMTKAQLKARVVAIYKTL